MKTILALTVALGAIALVAPRQAQADPLTRTSAGFGVGAATGSPSAIDWFTGQSFQNGVSTSTASNASATASVNLGAPIPTMGLNLLHNGTAQVVAAEGFTILGGPATVNFTLTGTFTPPPPTATPGDSGVTLLVYNYVSSGILASISFNGDTTSPTGLNYIINGGKAVPWTSGTSVTLSVPIVSSDLGIIADMSGDNVGSVPSYVIDFLDPVTMNFTPAPGGSVILATGQTFGAPVTAPEPSSVLLLGTGLLGILGMVSRRRRLA